MKFNKLGGSDLLVSEVCLGTMTFGQQNSEVESHEILDAAVKLGINFLDTAELYPVPAKAETQGRTEQFIGTWLAKHKGDAEFRKKLIIATKVTGYSDTMTWIPANRSEPRGAEAHCRLDRASILAACEASLRRLQTDYIDLYQLHWPDRYMPNFGKTRYDVDLDRAREAKEPSISFEETVGAIGELIKSKKIRYWGVCNETSFGIAELTSAAKKLGVPAPISIQNCYNLIHRLFDTELAESCSPLHHNLGLLPWSPLAGGQLTGKYLGGNKPDGSRSASFPQFQTRFFKNATEEAVKEYVNIAAKFNVSPAQLALAWCKSRSFVASTIIGATRINQLEENVKSFEIVLPKEALEAIDAVHRAYPNPSLED